MNRRDIREFRYSTLWKEDEDDIIFWNYTPNLEMDLEVAKELVNKRLEYCEGKSVYTLIDITNIKSSTKEARDFMNDENGGLKGVLGGAFLSNSIVSTLLVNLYLKVNTPTIPAKFFTNKDEAVGWLKKIKQEKSITR